MAIPLAYYGGHLAQSVGNIFESRLRRIEDVVVKGDGSYRIDDAVVTACVKKLGELKIDNPAEVTPRWLFRVRCLGAR